MAEVSDIVRFEVSLARGAAVQADFGRSMLLLDDDALSISLDGVLDGGGRNKVRTYSSLSALGADFRSFEGVYTLAQRYFSQDPYPKPLLVGRRNVALVQTSIRGGAPGPAAGWQAADATFTLDGNAVTADLSAAADLAAVATALLAPYQTAIGDATATITVAGGRLILSASDDADPFGGMVATAGATGTDVAGALGLDVGSGATHNPGGPAETVSEALGNINAQDNNWYFLLMDRSLTAGTSAAAVAADTAIAAAAAWTAATRGKIMFVESNEAGSLLATDLTSRVRAISLMGSQRNVLTFSRSLDYKAASAAARQSAVNLNRRDSYSTMKFKRLPGCIADTLSDDERTELDRKRVNYYTTYGIQPMYGEGVTADADVFIDQRHFMDWFTNEAQNRVFAYLVGDNAVPQRAAGSNAIRDVVAGVCRTARRSGAILPGTVPPEVRQRIAEATGNPGFDGELTDGYIVHVESFDDQSDADRSRRQLPAMTVWFPGGGAIHSAAAEGILIP